MLFLKASIHFLILVFIVALGILKLRSRKYEIDGYDLLASGICAILICGAVQLTVFAFT